MTGGREPSTLVAGYRFGPMSSRGSWRYEDGSDTFICTVSYWKLLGLSRWGRPFAPALKSLKLLMVGCCYCQDSHMWSWHKNAT